ncbi:MAG: OmpA family protein [Saprospiraceae bacterium]|nr:OmpA family protein [Saprospiraceae bacterium]
MRMLVASLILLIAASGCVSSRKYQDSELARRKLQSDYDDARKKAANYGEENAVLKTAMDKAQKDAANLRSDLALSRERYDQLDKTNKDLLTRYDRLLAQNEMLLNATATEKQDLRGQLAAKETELNNRERRMLQLERDLSAREQRVKELEAAINDKENKIADLRSKVTQALRGFSNTDLTVREEKGKVYVSLSQDLLFPSGSKTINSAGREALAKLSQVLNTNTEINITVEGHTDSDGDDALNWDLSVGRASSVVKELTKNNVDPKRVIAAGRGEHFPVAGNETTAGKAQNRRTEIILTPKLDVLYQILD